VKLKYMFVSIFIFLASMMALYANEGRYQVTLINENKFVLTDTKEGKFRICVDYWRNINAVICQPWFDANKDDLVLDNLDSFGNSLK
jgi:hypothetical protein